jgi:hypothetical protein
MLNSSYFRENVILDGESVCVSHVALFLVAKQLVCILKSYDAKDINR